MWKLQHLVVVPLEDIQEPLDPQKSGLMSGLTWIKKMWQIVGIDLPFSEKQNIYIGKRWLDS